MQTEAYERLAARQDVYWWHRARRVMALALLSRHGLKPGCRWLDLGCGPGGNLRMLDTLSPDLVVGADLSPLALDIAAQKAPGAALVRADLNAVLPFRDESFDAFSIFNVLYHAWVADEVAVLREGARVLRPGGLALITEPAFASLARGMDVSAMGRRRYHACEFRGFCEKAGLEVLLTNYFTSFGAAVLYLLNLAGRFSGARDHAADAIDMKPLKPVLNETLYRAARLEARMILAGVPVPFGTTLVCLARKRREV